MTRPNDVLHLDHLPKLPQIASLRELAGKLWQRHDVIALWLGGSFASGKADRYSDVDLRIAVPQTAMSQWDAGLITPFFDGRAIWFKTSFAGEDAALHHALLDNGESYDLWLQTPAREPHREPKLILGCRDAALHDVLSQPGVEERLEFKAAEAATALFLIKEYWSNHVKNEKVLHRGLVLLMRDGLYLFTGLLMRLQFMLATGQDCGEVRFPPMTIHTITPVLQTLQAHYGGAVQEIIGQPVRSRAENIAAIERLNEAIGHVGRQLAQQLDFVYPSALEDAVLKSWRRFLAAESADEK
ncbi:MAG: nucleotidyltransferase domain-containing protein [Caldilineaceae bacterium]